MLEELNGDERPAQGSYADAGSGFGRQQQRQSITHSELPVFICQAV